MDSSKVSSTSIDPSGSIVIATTISAVRSIKGLRLPPACSKSERREIERVLSKSLLGLEGDLKGDYYPLAHSTSYIPKPGGMSAEEEAIMKAEGLIFEPPDATVLLATGMGRHWPDARGVYSNETKDFVVWGNYEEHLRVFSGEMGSNVKSAFEKFVVGLNT